MRVVHLKVGHDDRHGQSHGEHAPEGADCPHEHAQVGLGHHVTVAHGGHRHQRPPQAQGDRVEVVVGVGLDPLGIVDQRGEDDNPEDEEEDKQHELLSGGAEGLQENLEAGGVTCEFEQPEDPDDREELQHIGVLEVGGEVGEEQIDVETHGGNKVDDVHRAADKFEQICGSTNRIYINSPLTWAGYQTYQ